MIPQFDYLLDLAINSVYLHLKLGDKFYLLDPIPGRRKNYKKQKSNNNEESTIN